MKNRIMNISNELLGKTLFYETNFWDGKNFNPVCDFGKVDSITIDIKNTDNEPEFLTLKDNKGRLHNFCTKEKQKTNNYIAQNIDILQIANI